MLYRFKQTYRIVKPNRTRNIVIIYDDGGSNQRLWCVKIAKNKRTPIRGVEPRSPR